MRVSRSTYVLHNMAHVALPFSISTLFLLIDPLLDSFQVLVAAIAGGFLPDIDHINMWFEYKFKNFRSFLKFATTVRTYRYSFLVFHNLASLIALILLIPLVNTVSTIAAVFLTTFLAHLCLDFFTDKICLGRVTHWRYRRRT
jgi:uncharacterized protein involved in cysteine biosynthesis